MSRWLCAAWFIPLTALNWLTWRLVPCEWSRPYRRSIHE